MLELQTRISKLESVGEEYSNEDNQKSEDIDINNDVDK